MKRASQAGLMRAYMILYVLMLEVTMAPLASVQGQVGPLLASGLQNIRGMRSCSPLAIQVKALFAKALKDAFPSLQQDVGSPDPSG